VDGVQKGSGYDGAAAQSTIMIAGQTGLAQRLSPAYDREILYVSAPGAGGTPGVHQAPVGLVGLDVLAAATQLLARAATGSSRLVVRPAAPTSGDVAVAVGDGWWSVADQRLYLLETLVGGVAGWVRCGGAPYIQVWTSSGMFTMPAGCSTLEVFGCGVGAPGSSGKKGPSLSARGGGGGGAAAPWRRRTLILAPGTVIAVTIGTLGTPGPSRTVNGQAGAAATGGTDSLFGTLIRFKAGLPGSGGTSAGGAGGLSLGNSGGAGGAGGVAGTPVGSTGQPSLDGMGAGGGGGGGGINTADLAAGGGPGGGRADEHTVTGSGPTAGGAVGADGANGAGEAGDTYGAGRGGGGGGASNTGNAGKGGDGSDFGAGGGGGGAALDNVGNSGPGGQGGRSVIVAIAR
jgi:hypothetical protein